MSPFDVTLRWVPGHIWVRFVVTSSREMKYGHAWLYAGLVKRDAWKLGPFGLAILRMPARSPI